MSQKKPTLGPGFLELDRRGAVQIIWITCLSSRSHDLERILRNDFGITGKRYTQLPGRGLAPRAQKDLLSTYLHHRPPVILMNGTRDEVTTSFLATHSIPYVRVDLAEGEAAFRSALIKTLRHVSTPCPA